MKRLFFQRPWMRRAAAGLAVIVVLLGIWRFWPQPSADLRLVGTYRLDDGRLLVVSPRDDETLRARFPDDGASYRLFPSGGLAYVSGAGWDVREPSVLQAQFSLGDDGRAAAVCWRMQAAAQACGQRLDLAEIPLRISSDGQQLAAKIVLPAGDGPFPAVVLVHGSERISAVHAYAEPYILAANGIAVLVYDKRGTGNSQGTFTMNFDLLADDAVAAVAALRDRPEIDPARVGLLGFSQGGWVAPLAALRAMPAYVLVAYGLAVSPAEEDRLQTLNVLREQGYGEDVLIKADALIAAVHTVIRSDYATGWEELDRLAAQSAGEPWIAGLDAGMSGDFLRYPQIAMRTIGAQQMHDLSFGYDPIPTLAQLPMPQLWLIGERDREAPPAETLQQLAQLEAAGHPIAQRVFPGADHGMLLFDEQAGQRTPTGYHPDFYRTMIAWIQTQ